MVGNHDITEVCQILSITPYDIFTHAVRVLPEDLRDIVDPRDVYLAYLHHNAVPDWVHEFMNDIMCEYNNPSLF